MPGFGSNPFGSQSFGEYAWSRAVLYDTLPEIYRREDESNSYLLEKFSEGQRPLYDGLRRKIRAFFDLRDPYSVRSSYNDIQLLRLGRNIPIKTEIEQRGLDGKVLVSKAFFSDTARFTSKDIGKELIVLDSSVATNNKAVMITSVIGPTQVTTSPTLSTDAGPFRWEIRALSTDNSFVRFEVQSGDVGALTPGWFLTDGGGQFVLKARRQLRTKEREIRLLTEKEGVDGVINPSGFFVSTSAVLSSRDIGKKLTIADSAEPTNNTTIEIQALSGSTVVIPSWFVVYGADSNGNVAYSSLGADFGGELPRIRHLKQGLSTSLAVSVNGPDVTVTLQTDSLGSINCSAAEVAAAVNADTYASEIFRATALGSGTGTAGEVSYSTVTGQLLTNDAGPLSWALLPRPEIDLEGASLPRGFVEQEGVDLEIVIHSTSPSVVESSSAQFTSNDIGKLLTIRGSSSGNDGTYEVVNVLSTTELELGEILIGAETGLFYELRSPTSVGDLTLLSCNAPSLLTYLARDFGEEIDNQQNESRQRSTVADQKHWIGVKGHPDSYRVLGLMSGFDVEVTRLYRIGQDLFASIPDGDEFQIGDTRPGKSGDQGALTVGTLGRVQFTSSDTDPLPDFTASDIGTSIVISGAATVGNNKSYVIEEIIDSSSVYFRVEDSATVPDANNNLLTWGIVRYYTDLAPLLPLSDEFNGDAFASYVELVNAVSPTKVLSIDKFCWEDDFYATIHTDITAVTTIADDRHLVTVARSGTISGLPIGDVSAIVVTLGVWRLEDSTGTQFYLDTVPVAVSGTSAQFEVLSAIAPSTGEASVTYVCPEFDFGCDWCAASVALATCEVGSIAEESGVAVQQVFDRLLTRLEEATPIHVQLVPRWSQTVRASFSLGAGGFADGVFPDLATITGTGTVSSTAALTLGASSTMTGSGTVTVSGTAPPGDP